MIQKKIGSQKKTLILYNAIQDISTASREELESAREYCSYIFLQAKKQGEKFYKRDKIGFTQSEQISEELSFNQYEEYIARLRSYIYDLSLIINGLDSEKTAYQKVCEEMGIK